MVDYHKAQSEINPDFVPKIGWLQLFHRYLCINNIHSRQKPQNKTMKPKNLFDIENNRYIANVFMMNLKSK